ncbi:calcium-binding protein [Roseibium sp. M-1]
MTKNTSLQELEADFIQNLYISALAKYAQQGSANNVDELRILSTTGYVLDYRQTSLLQNIDRFDLSAAANGGVVVRIDNYILDQSDDNRIDLQFSQQGHHRVDLMETTSGNVVIDGAGQLELRGLQQAPNSAGVTFHLAESADFDVTGSRGSETVVGNDADTVWNMGSGDDVVTGGGGVDTFIFDKGHDSFTIRDFTVGEDVLDLRGYSFFNQDHLFSLARQEGENVILQLSGNDVIIFENSDLDELYDANVTYQTNTNYNNSGITSKSDTMFSREGNTYFIDTGVSVDVLNAFIADAPAGSTIILREGVHRFTDSLVIDRPDITLKGESEAGTKLVFDLDPEISVDGIVVGSRSIPEDVTTVARDTSEGSKVLLLKDASEISEGDYLYISQENTASYLRSKGDTEYDSEQAAKSPFRETLVKVVAVDGNKVYLENEVGQEFDAGKATVGKVDLLEGVSVQDLTITYHLSDHLPKSLRDNPNHNDFENVLPEFLNAAGVHVLSTYGFDMSGVSVVNAASHGFWIQNSLSLRADDLYTNGSYNKGTAGNGYGVQLYETFHSSFSNLELFNNRHAFLFSSWHAEDNNTIHISETNRDINFHGSFDHSNTVIVDKLVLEYQPDQNTSDLRGYWTAISPGGKAHVETDIYGENKIILNYVVGHDADDYLCASDTLYFMAGGGGNDELHGNARDNYILGEDGDDVIYAGNGCDHVAGGNGNDTIIDDHGHDVLYGNDGNDTISSGMGQDFVSGGRGKDNINSGSGNDVVHGGADADTIDGSGGDDELFGDEGNDWINGGSGNDLIEGGDGNDTIYGSAGEDDLRGGAGDDLISGGYSDDRLDGGDGNDILKGNSGADYMSGGNGNDKLYGGAAGDEMYGDAGNDFLYGDTGHDRLHGGSGDDTLCGEVGSDKLFGDSGDDRLYGATGNDYLDGGTGNDRLDGGDDNDVLIGGLGNDRLVGGEGADQFVFAAMAKNEADRILDFQSGLDVIDISGMGLDGLQDLMIATYGDGVKISFDNGASIVLDDFRLADLHQSDFIF